MSFATRTPSDSRRRTHGAGGAVHAHRSAAQAGIQATSDITGNHRTAAATAGNPSRTYFPAAAC